MNVTVTGLESGRYRYVYHQLVAIRNTGFANPEIWYYDTHINQWLPGEVINFWERCPDLNATCLKIRVRFGPTWKAIWRTVIEFAPFKPAKIWIRSERVDTDIENYAVECLERYVQEWTPSVPESYLTILGDTAKVFEEKLSSGTEFRLNQWDRDIEVSGYDRLTVEVEQKCGTPIGALEDHVAGVKINLAYTPINTLAVRIIDENKNPVPGASARIYEMDKIVSVAEGIDEDYDGIVAFDLEAGKYWVKAYFNDRESEFVFADLVADKTVTVSIGLGEEYWFSAVVVAATDYPEWDIVQGDPVPGVRIQLIKDTTPYYDDITDETGRTPDKTVVSGTYTLKTEKGDWKTRTEVFALVSDRTAYGIALEHNPPVYYSMVVSVFDDGVPARPIAGAFVEVTDGSSDSGFTDLFGKFTTVPLLAGHYRVSVTYAGFTGIADVYLDREFKEARVTVPLSGLTHTLIITVMDTSTGEVIPMVRGDFYKAGELVTTLFTDSSGRILADLTEGDYLVTLSKKSYRSKDRNFSLMADMSFVETMEYIAPPPAWVIPATLIGTTIVVSAVVYSKREAIQTRLARGILQ